MDQATDSDIYRSASNLLKRHGKDAATIATMWADDYLKQGDLDAYRRWKRVVLLVDVMLVGDDFPDPEIRH
ncbi:MAG: hypothetical protein OQJ99_06235 [Rhodospirillales bacterium]|nr:hypothetical protein [Rhodospirillales bacterium]MCW8862007.1 hypothetical protein [Rhodospirillales bacterium]MCW8952977.1 hypothetical protein [Rhodospirillales bacterium]MCW8970631.1 hypothetical protein [Rhodospirillales bacterium]MCW9002331.1 hypothetical protein [Rhodospirillales bacterium]